MSLMYQFKISLKYSRPLIWRRVLVPESFTFGRLHRVIQALFGWENCHLHEFVVGRPYQSQKISGNTPIARYFGHTRKKATYVYDFGDDWIHDIMFEKAVEKAGQMYPVCVEGKFNAPPEDCGGLFGYYRMLNAIEDRKHPDREDLMEWLGDDFDPCRFDITLVNKNLRRIKSSKETQAFAGFHIEG